MRSAHIIILLCASALLVLVTYVGNAGRVAQLPDDTDTWICPGRDWLCMTVSTPLRTFIGATHRQARKQVNANALPVLSLYLTDGALQKLNTKRQKTLDEPVAILLTEPDDWVAADIVADYNGTESRAKAAVRLKGDWGDHIKHPKKRSLRIKIKGNTTILGQSRFSIQHPITRGYQNEPLLFLLLKKLDVLVPRYMLVDVRLNGYDIGLMALEEHFTKELIESQSRREGPIITIDEDQFWRQRHLSANRTDITWEEHGLDFGNAVHYKVQDYPVRSYGKSRFDRQDAKTNNHRRAQSLYRDIIDGRRQALHGVDLDLTAKWYVATHAFAATHGVGFHNLKFYFNPVTELLEPVGFDNHAPDIFPYEYKNSIIVDRLLHTEPFQLALNRALKTVEQILHDPEFEQAFHGEQDRWLNLLRIEGFKKLAPRRLDELRQNLAQFKTDLAHKMANTEPALSTRNESITPLRTFLTQDTPVHTHMRAFLYASPNEAVLEIKNLMHKPITIERIDRHDDEGPIRISQNVTLPADAGTKPYQHIWQMDLGPYLLPRYAKHTITYRYDGKTYTHPVRLQFSGQTHRERTDFLSQAARLSPHIRIDDKSKTVTFEEGQTVFKESYSLPKGWAVIFEPGANILFQHGALVRIEGNVLAQGTEDRPVRLTIASRENLQGLGSWGGLIIVRAPDLVDLNHVIVRGAGPVAMADRQDTSGLTGCLTIYESPTRIQNSKFENTQCEDGLNIIRSEFKMTDTLFDGTDADAFDADFSQGTITNTRFRRTGNDGLDISGSQVTIASVAFKDIGDKAMSVGEASQLTGQDITVDGAVTGIASKDLSEAQLSNAEFANVKGSDLIAYIKKTEYGPASITCESCRFDSETPDVALQSGSSIRINGVEHTATSFSEQNLEEVGGGS